MHSKNHDRYFSIFTTMQSEKTGLLVLLLSAYTFSVGFTDVLSLPVVGKKIQIPELIFIPLFITWIFLFGKTLVRKLKPDGLQWSMLSFLLVMIISAVVANQLKGYLEIAGLVYLIFVFLIFKTSLPVILHPEKWITKTFVVCGLVAASLGIMGWLLFQFGINNTFIKLEPHYPYFGQIARATGLTTTPNMLFNLVSVCLLVYCSYFLSLPQNRVQHYIAGSILAVGVILTFSKTILLLFIGMLILWHQHSKSKNRKVVLTGIGTLLLVICMIGTHFIFIHSSADQNQNVYEGYFKNKPITSIGEYQVFPSNYTVLKEASIIAGTENLFGVGPGGNNEFLQKLKSEGRYPEYFENFDPHSVYTGTFGELGILGLLALLWMMYEVARRLHSIQKTNNYLAKGLLACFIFFALEGFVLDILNFRHLWILLGLLGFERTKNQKTSN